VYSIITDGFVVRIVSGARKHGVSRRRIEQALMSQTEADVIGTETTDPKIRFVGRDERGEEIEIVAVVLPGLLLIIHAMPTRYRRKSR
jgi:hypothetical protein